MDPRFFFLAVIDQGGEVLLFDPAYETINQTCIELAGGAGSISRGHAVLRDMADPGAPS